MGEQLLAEITLDQARIALWWVMLIWLFGGSTSRALRNIKAKEEWEKRPDAGVFKFVYRLRLWGFPAAYITAMVWLWP